MNNFEVVQNYFLKHEVVSTDHGMMFLPLMSLYDLDHSYKL